MERLPKTGRDRHKKTPVGLRSNRRGMGTCVRAYVLDTRAPVYVCVHMPKMCVIESRGECMSVRRVGRDS